MLMLLKVGLGQPSQTGYIKKPRSARAGGVGILKLDSSPLRRVAAYAYYYAYDNYRHKGDESRTVSEVINGVHREIAKQK
jgi:hypothetical protein